MTRSRISRSKEGIYGWGWGEGGREGGRCVVVVGGCFILFLYLLVNTFLLWKKISLPNEIKSNNRGHE